MGPVQVPVVCVGREDRPKHKTRHRLLYILSTLYYFVFLLNYSFPFFRRPRRATNEPVVSFSRLRILFGVFIIRYARISSYISLLFLFVMRSSCSAKKQANLFLYFIANLLVSFVSHSFAMIKGSKIIYVTWIDTS